MVKTREKRNPPDARGARILLVDDNPTTLEEMRAALDDGVRSITTVRDGFSAERYIREHGGDVDILVTDYHLRRGPKAQPQGDALARIAREVNPRIKTVLVSGDLGDADLSAVDAPVQKLNRTSALMPPSYGTQSQSLMEAPPAEGIGRPP